MRPHPWTYTRRFLAGLQIGAVATLFVLIPALLPISPVFAHELPRSAAATPSAKDSVELGSTQDILHENREDNAGSRADDSDSAELEGTLEIQVEDREDGSAVYRHVLSAHDGRRLSLEGVQHPDLLTGDLVRVKGFTSGQTLHVQAKSSGNLEVLQYASLANTFGPQKVVVLLVNFSNDQSKPITVSGMQSQMALTDTFYRESSYGQTSLSVDVFGWYTLPMTSAGCSTATIKAKADQAATAAGINLSAYSRRVYFFPYTSTCYWGGKASIGGSPSSAWINGSLMSIAHELGHNFGLYHSRSMSCTPNSLSASGCTISEYGDTPDMMGGLGGPFNAFQKQRLGWLGFGESPPITNVTQSGTYPLDAYSTLGTLPKALKIQRGATSQAFWVELRTSCPGCAEPGVYIRLATDGVGNSSYLLDMTPVTPMWTGPTLAVGQSFTDSVSGITIRTLSVSGTSATIMVDMDGTGPSCVRSAPSVTATPGQSPAVQPGTAVTYSVSVTNADSAACSASSFTLQATVPTTSWQKSFGASSVTANPGATVSTTLQITSPSVPTGVYTIVSAATRTTVAPVSGSASMLYTVTVAPGSGGTGTPGTFTDTFDRPDAPVLGNGWSVMTGGLKVQAGEGRNEPSNTFGLAVQSGLTGAAQTVEARFASTDNNRSPRFGVVVRYRDPQNYYVCYRQMGGSSVVRIAKVQNGVETVLKSAGFGNPTLNVFSTLACQASGNTLTLRLDGVTKLAMTDGTFTTGSAGYTISTKVGGSHRVDNFSAIIQ